MKSWQLDTLAVEPHAPQVVSTSNESRAIVIQLPAGERLQDHQVHERAWLCVVAGEVEVTSASDPLRGGAGLLVEFDPAERHEVTARTDARLLLLLAPWPGAGHPSGER